MKSMKIFAFLLVVFAVTGATAFSESFPVTGVAFNNSFNGSIMSIEGPSFSLESETIYRAIYGRFQGGMFSLEITSLANLVLAPTQTP
ncbi:MAG: hypothetical protein ACRD22_17405 [Terriglobia bacterium]